MCKFYNKKIKLPFKVKKPTLAMGAQTKNTVCFAKGDFAYLSPVHTDLGNPKYLLDFEETVTYFLKENPKIIAYDLHPEYQSTKYILNLRPNTSSLIPIQHHHAHITSCMVENNLDEKVIGVALDGLGYGDDGTLWGAEFLVADYKDYQRAAYLAYIPLLGRDKAILEPWRITAAWLYRIYGDKFLKLDIDFVKRLDRFKWKNLRKLYHTNLMPSISSMGRLFDAISSLLGVRDKVNYEGQAAVELQMLIKTKISLNKVKPFNYHIRKSQSVFIIEPDLIFKEVIGDLKKKIPLEIISLRFHKTIAFLIKDVCLRLKNTFHLNKVVLSGGVFQNMVLLNITYGILKKSEFSVFIHRQIPTNDSGISLGQIAIANSSVLNK